MSLSDLPQNLPVPVDDGAASHLACLLLPDVTLTATSGETVNLAALKGYAVIYIYPMTGRPDLALPDGWDAIPGARGCTPQSCSFRDHYDELKAWDVTLYGLSTQSTEYQQEVKARLNLPYELLSDEGRKLKDAMALPTFTVEGMELYKRLTMIAKDGEIIKVFYPVFPPDKNAGDVVVWFQNL